MNARWALKPDRVSRDVASAPICCNHHECPMGTETLALGNQIVNRNDCCNHHECPMGTETFPFRKRDRILPVVATTMNARWALKQVIFTNFGHALSSSCNHHECPMGTETGTRSFNPTATSIVATTMNARWALKHLLCSFYLNVHQYSVATTMNARWALKRC